MPRLLSKETKDSIWQQVKIKGADPLTDAEVDQLCIVLRSESLIKALSQVYNLVRFIPGMAMQNNMATAEGITKVTLAQGEMVGIEKAIDFLLDLVTVQEEPEEGGEEQ